MHVKYPAVLFGLGLQFGFFFQKEMILVPSFFILRSCSSVLLLALLAFVIFPFNPQVLNRMMSYVLHITVFLVCPPISFDFSECSFNCILFSVYELLQSQASQNLPFSCAGYLLFPFLYQCILFPLLIIVCFSIQHVLFLNFLCKMLANSQIWCCP